MGSLSYPGVAFQHEATSPVACSFGLEFFNLTDHANPRDVYAVAGSARFGTFTNSVGPTVRGVSTLTW